MEKTLPSQAPEHEAAPRISLAGESWPIPVLAPKQNRTVVPTVLRIMPQLGEIMSLLQTDPARAATLVSEAFYDDVTKIVYLGLTRAHPKMTREEFDNLPVTTPDLFGAITTIARQTGMMRTPVPGEQKAEEESPQIGTSS